MKCSLALLPAKRIFKTSARQKTVLAMQVPNLLISLCPWPQCFCRDTCVIKNLSIKDCHPERNFIETLDTVKFNDPAS